MLVWPFRCAAGKLRFFSRSFLLNYIVFMSVCVCVCAILFNRSFAGELCFSILDEHKCVFFSSLTMTIQIHTLYGFLWMMRIMRKRGSVRLWFYEVGMKTKSKVINHRRCLCVFERFCWRKHDIDGKPAVTFLLVFFPYLVLKSINNNRSFKISASMHIILW